MARKSNTISKEDISALRKLVKAKSAHAILYPVDCKKLSSEVFTKTGEYISDSTLKRFMGFVQSPFTPSYDTIRILRLFVSISQTSAEEIHVNFIVDFFNPVHYTVIQQHDTGFQAACRTIAINLRKNQSLFEKVMERIAQSETGRRFYFDLFPDLEILGAFQYKGYELFLIHEKRYEGRIFAHCVLFLKYYFEKDTSGMAKHYEAVNAIFQKSKPLHPYVLGRFYQISLMYCHKFHPRRMSKLISDIVATEKNQSRKAKDLFRDFPCFHYYVCDGLYHAAQYDTLLLISKKALQDFPKTKEFIWKGYYDQLKIYNAYALLSAGKKKEAEALVKKIDTSGFYFISKLYFENLYAQLKEEL